MPSQRRRDVPVQVPLRYWFVGGSAVAVSISVSGFGPGLSSPLSLSWGSLVTSTSTGPGGAPVGGATVVVTRVRLSPHLTSGVVEEIITSDLFQVPTTAARHGGRLAVVNAKFDTGIPPTADQYEVVLVNR